MKIVKNRIRFVGASIGTASAIGLGTLALAGGSAVAVGATSVAAPERASVDRLFTRAISAGQAAPAFADVARGGIAASAVSRTEAVAPVLDTPTGKGFFVRGDKDSCITLANPDATVTGCTRNSVLAGGKQPLMVSLDYGDYASVLVVVPDNVESVSTTASKAEKVSASGTVLLTLPSTPNALNMQTIRGETVKVDFGSPSVR